ncbi:MAG: hypothetical protein VZQ47_00405 [Treponema sp.]|nr:hypothetical protein [Treponema sp.]MEE3434003.1 hypothetical protein [Treponema sp.]
MIRERANRLAKFISSCMTTALAAFAALACFSCSNFEEGAFLKKYGDIASVTSIYPSRGLISEGGRLYTDDTDELVIDYYVDNPGHDEFECSLSVPGVTDLVAEGITVTSDNINRITVTYPQGFLASRNVDTGGTGDVSPYVSIVRKSDNYAQCYDNRALYCNTRPPAASALSQLYSDTTVDPPINERLVVCFSVATIPTDVYLLRVVDKRSGTVHSYDVSGGTIADQTSNGWDLTSTAPGTLEPTYDGGPAFTPTGPAYYIATDVQNLKSRTPFDIELTFYDRGGLSSAATVSSHARKLAAPTCNVSSGFETNTFAQPYIDFIIYAPSNCADATLHFAIEDEDGNPVADINGNVSTVTGAASFRFYPKINGYANRYTITEAYATKAGWINSDDAASTFGTGGNVNVNGETLSALTYSLTSGSSYPQETELVITSPEGADITWTHIGHAVETDPSPVRFTFEAAGTYLFAAQPIKDYYTSPAIENTTYDITATMVYVASYGHGPGDTPAGDGTKDNPFNNFADAINLLGTAGSATNSANTIYVLDDMTSIDGLSDFSNGYYNIVGCKGKTPGSPVNLGVNGGGTVLSVNGTATVSLRAITITGDTNAASGVVSVLGGTFILKDKVNITGNTYASGNARNISLGSGQKINVDADGLAGTKVGISAVDVPTTGNPVVFTSGYAASASAADLPYAHFTSDSGYAAILSEATATLGEAAFAVGGGSIDIGDIYSVDFAVADSAGVYTVSATATPTSGSPLDITSEVTAWSLKLYYLNTYTGMASATNTMDLSALGEGTYIMKISAVYGAKAYSGEVEIVKGSVGLSTPLTLEAAVAGAVVAFENKASGPVTYRVNGGTEQTIASGASKDITLSAAGDKVQFYGDNEAYATGASNYSSIACTKDCYVYGNIMSLVKSAGFASETTLTESYAFASLFRTNERVKNKAGYELLLPATTLSDRCYYWMFGGCTGLTVAPALPATTLANYCYNNMFNGCTSLNSVTCLATDISATDCTRNWLNGVASSGTFTKAMGVDWSGKTGFDGIPSGWTVQTAP